MANFTYRPLAYTSPQTGTRIEFSYDGTLSDGVTHNLGEFQFSGVDEKYFQDRSLTSDEYGFNIFLDSQDDLKTVRQLFDEKVTQGKTGSLEHPDPSLGTFPVCVASYKVDQNSVKGIGVISVSVVFYKTIPNLVGGDPSESNNPASAMAMSASIDDLNVDQATRFADEVKGSAGKGFATIVEKTNAIVETAESVFSSIASKVDSVNIAFTSSVAETLSTADELARSPFDLARQVQTLIQLPMLAIDSATERLDAYEDYVSEVLDFTNDDKNEFAGATTSGKNTLSVTGVAVLAAISAINYSAVSTDSATISDITSGEDTVPTGYLSRSDILSAIKTVQTVAVNATEELSKQASNFDDTTFFKQYFDYSILDKTIISATVTNLQKRIYNSAREVTITNDVERGVVQACADLYGTVNNNTIQFLIDSNGLHGDEIFLIPKGKELIYYV